MQLEVERGCSNKGNIFIRFLTGPLLIKVLWLPDYDSFIEHYLTLFYTANQRGSLW